MLRLRAPEVSRGGWVLWMHRRMSPQSDIAVACTIPGRLHSRQRRFPKRPEDPAAISRRSLSKLPTPLAARDRANHLLSRLGWNQANQIHTQKRRYAPCTTIAMLVYLHPVSTPQ